MPRTETIYLSNLVDDNSIFEMKYFKIVNYSIDSLIAKLEKYGKSKLRKSQLFVKQTQID